MKISVSKILTNKWVLNIVSIIAFFNVIGYIVTGKMNEVIFFILISVLVSYFSKNMIIILGIPLILVNLFAFKNTRFMEGMTSDKNNESKNNESKKHDNSDSLPSKTVESSNEKSGFEVGRTKNGSSKIDYASTIEDAYNQLNQVLGSEGIQNLTSDTQKLMQQQMELAKSMEAMTPLIKGIMPMAEKAQEMMKNMDSGTGGLGNMMEMVKKMSGSLTK